MGMSDVDWGPWVTKLCDRCHTVWPLANFSHAPGRGGAKRTCTFSEYECPDPTHYADVCICCRNTRKHRRLLWYRVKDKVRRSVNRHRKQDGFKSVKGWEAATGLTVAAMTDEVMDILNKNTCPHCRGPVAGSRDITLDRRDRHKPLTRDNYQWICETCNKEKARTPEHIWEIRSRCWDLYVAYVDPYMPEQERFDF